LKEWSGFGSRQDLPSDQIGEDIDGDAAYDFFGNSVSLSANGWIVAIRAPYAVIDGVIAGQVKVY
jgi:hypothetical protein